MFTTPLSYRRVIFAVIVSLALGCSAALAQMSEQQALGAFYYGAREYNLITFGDYNANGQDTWGAVAVGGNFSDSGGITLGEKSWCAFTDTVRSSISDPFVLINGSITLASNATPKVKLGTLAINPTTVADGVLLSDRFRTTEAESPYILYSQGFANWTTASSVIQFAALKDKLTSANKVFDAQVNTGFMTDSSITATGTGVKYLDVNANAFNNKDLNLSVSKDAFLVINLHVNSTNGQVFSPTNVKVDGIDASNDKALVDSSANRILWNVVFDDAAYSSLNVKTHDIYGSFLSIGTIDANGRIWGQVIANAFNQSSQYEVHQALMQVSMTMIPEPSTIALGMGALALGFVFWRRRQQQQA